MHMQRMRISLKRLFFYAIVAGLTVNFYIFYHFFNQVEEYADENRQRINDKEFLVLDWTGQQHVFKEDDPIRCDFSHITPDYCQTKFHSLTDTALRLELTERCSRLSTLLIRWTTDRSRLHEAHLLAYHSIHIPSSLPKLTSQQFSTVYILESEVHSNNGERWHEIDFPIWYNLERSYPEPATYFDLRIYLKQLFTPIQVPFTDKTTAASIIWISSNCHTYNDRHLFVRQLMSYMIVHSYGDCLNNIRSNDITISRKSNALIYSKYKFVLAIENSNCEDYITEKFIEAFASTSIPIIAGRNGKPDYQRFAPKHSYINIYDYQTIPQLVNYLNYLSNNQTAYNEYLWFRSVSRNNDTFEKQSLNDSLHLADEIFGVNSIIRQWLLTKETSRNKYCKLAEFIQTNDWNGIHQREKIDRPTADEVCLPRHDLVRYFSDSSNIVTTNLDLCFILIALLQYIRMDYS